jgi:carboxypeptidase Q
MKAMRTLAALAALAGSAASAPAQSLPVEDPVLRRIWTEGMQSSQAMDLMQVLADSIGPRLTGTPGSLAGQAWLQRLYTQWGITARSERYGTWTGWRRGPSHIDLIAPRVRSLEGTMLAWSPGTRGRPVEAATIILEDPADSLRFNAWLPTAKGRFVLASPPQPSCRPDSSYREWAGSAAFEVMSVQRAAIRTAWAARSIGLGLASKALARRLEEAGALGVITSNWTGGWGVTRIFRAQTTTVPTVELSCEDYGLVFRLTERSQGPVLRITAESESLGEVPVANLIGEIRGSERPGEYVMLSAHFDSWDGGSGATDNGTGTIMMLEAMRILRAAYPQPKRTILVGHWNSEENGLIGSRAYAEDHPEIVQGLHALFNHDDGAGLINSISAAGLVGASASLAGWFARLPGELSQGVVVSFPGTPATGGTDSAAFACYGAPAFGLGSESADYGTYTWHTGRDTYDKVLAGNLRRNATLVAMLAYLAASDSAGVSRERRMMPIRGDGTRAEWPACTRPARRSSESTR